MAITPKTRSQYGAVLCAMLCVGVTTGCHKHTIPWEHPTAFNKTPACDEAGPCRDGSCYVPPPPVMNSDCYGYQFTCWHPWPEHCQPQCNNGVDGPCMTVSPHPAAPTPAVIQEAIPPMPPSGIPAVAPPMTTNEPPLPSSAPPASPPPASAPPVDENQTWSRPRYERPQTTNSAGPRDNSREAAHTPSPARDYGRPSNYGYMSAVSESNAAMRDDSVRPVSGVTRLQSPGTSASSEGQKQPAPNANRDGLERFRW